MSTAPRHASVGLRSVPRVRFLPLALGWFLVVSVVVGVVIRDPGSQTSLVVGNLGILVALLFGAAATTRAALLRTPASRGWVWMSAGLVLTTVMQSVFTWAIINRTSSGPTPLVDTLGSVGYALPALAALFLFPKPPERLIARSRSVMDAVVITAGVVFVSEATVLNRSLVEVMTDPQAGLSGLLFPIADLAICSVVLTLGLRQAPGDRLTWLCLGSGLVILAVTDSVYVRLQSEGLQDLTGSALVVGWMAAPVLIGLATLVPRTRVDHGWNLALAVRLIPYLPVLGAMILLGVMPIRNDPFLLVCGIVLLVSLTIRQVMIVYENLTLTRDLEVKVSERTAELAILGSIVTSSSDAIVGISMDNVITAWNPAAERLLGISADDVLGRNPDFLSAGEFAAIRELLHNLLSGGKLVAYEMDWTRPDGQVIPVALTLSPIVEGATVKGISVFAQDITERTRTAAALEQAREEALESSRLKSDFLATMSHEIRTPMNGVIGLTSLLIDTDLDRTQRKYAEGVQNAGQSLLDVINDILDFSKLEAGKVEIEASDFDLRRLVEDVGSLLAPAAFAKGLELLVSYPPNTPTMVRGDNVRIRQILLNLASNGIKFTASGEVIVKVKSERLEDDRVKLRFEVSDTGIGVAEADQDRLFESFSQADASTTRRFGGTGLGLAISRHLVEAMDGEIGMRSRIGVGSTFWFEINLPLGDATNPEPDRLSELLRGRRVLVVDDNATNRTLLDAQLTSWRMVVDLVDGASVALERLRAAADRGEPFDLAVLDMLLPDIDGLQLAQSIKADPVLTGLPLIMLTSAHRLPARILREAGIGQWLTKPVSSSELYDRLVRLMAPKDGCQETQGDQTPARAQQPSRGRILVVEDNPLNQLVAAGLVSRLGFEVDTVSDGRQALTSVAAVAYAAVLMDCHMPVMDGFAATEEIRRRQGAGGRIPIIALTAGALVSDRERCLAAGMDDYIPKPIDAESLAEALDRWVVPLPTATPPANGNSAGGDSANANPAGANSGNGVAASPESGPIDRSRLEVLRSFESPDGSSLLNTLINTFVNRSQNRLAALQQAALAGNFDDVSMAAHELRGSASTIGAVRVAAICAELEHSGNHRSPIAPEQLEALDRALQHAVSELADLAAPHA